MLKSACQGTSLPKGHHGRLKTGLSPYFQGYVNSRLLLDPQMRGGGPMMSKIEYSIHPGDTEARYNLVSKNKMWALEPDFLCSYLALLLPRSALLGGNVP